MYHISNWATRAVPSAKPTCPQCGRRILEFMPNAVSAIAACKRLRKARGQKACR